MQRNSFSFSRYGALWIAALVLSFFAGCSGGGGGEDDQSSGDLRTEACDVLGAKIINGGSCNPARAAVVRYDVSYSSGSGSLCSGTLISNRHILTAAHCFDDVGRSVTSIGVQIAGQTIAASGFAVHPGFSIRNDSSLPLGIGFFNDAAIIELPSAVSVAPIPLLLSRATQPTDVISIFGYGLDENGEFGTLQSGEMQLDQVLPNQLVASFDGAGSNTCQGDSGGPAIVSVAGLRGIVGLTSSGDAESECRVGDISLFANIQAPSILNFILDIVPNAAQI